MVDYRVERVRIVGWPSPSAFQLQRSYHVCITNGYVKKIFSSDFTSSQNINMILEVYLDPCTVNSRKVLAGLDLLGTEFHLNHVDYLTREHKGEKYLKINPHATVPSAVDGGPQSPNPMRS